MEGQFFSEGVQGTGEVLFSSLLDHLTLVGKLLATCKVFDVQYDEVGKV